jgi:flagellar basal-body rod protein FlgB
MNIFATAESHMSWLTARQAITSTNIANVDTPGFKSREISPFGKELQLASTRLTTSSSRHLQAPNLTTAGHTSQLQNNDEATLSGNDVVMEKEMRAAGESTRLFSFDIGLLRSFHRMLLTSVKA